MKLLYKRIFWIGSVIMFIVLIPLVMGYALGYRYNWQKNQFEKTGILYIKTYPTDTNIYLNNKLIGNNTPLQVNRLLTGRYNLKIEKPNYLSWEKEIMINEQQTTFIEDVVLYQNPKDKILNEYPISDYLINNQENRLFYVAKNDIGNAIYILQTRYPFPRVIHQTEGDTTLELISVSSNAKKIIYLENNNYWIINAETPLDNYQINLASEYLQEIFWHADNDNYIYAKVNKTLYFIDLRSKNNYIQSSITNINKFAVGNDYVYYTKDSNQNHTSIFYRANKDLKEAEEIALLPIGVSWQTAIGRDQIVITDQDLSIAYLINPSADNIITNIFPQVNNAKWYHLNYDKILFWNKNEIYVYYQDRQEKDLIIRQTGNISNAWWHPNGSYIFYYSDNFLNLIELDNRDKKNKYRIKGTENLDSIVINDKGDKIYYIQNNQLIEKTIQ